MNCARFYKYIFRNNIGLFTLGNTVISIGNANTRLKLQGLLADNKVYTISRLKYFVARCLCRVHAHQIRPKLS